jgi:hypothetical protein
MAELSIFFVAPNADDATRVVAHRICRIRVLESTASPGNQEGFNNCPAVGADHPRFLY